MARIWKYQLAYPGATTLEIPKGSQVLYAGVQRGELCLWVLVNTEGIREKRIFNVVGTEWELDNKHTRESYIGTIQLEGVFVGNLVFHVFDLGVSAIPRSSSPSIVRCAKCGVEYEPFTGVYKEMADNVMQQTGVRVLPTCKVCGYVAGDEAIVRRGYDFY